MNVLGLFSGIGGFEYGLQKAGYNITAMCEIEPYPVSVLKKNFSSIPIFNDVKDINKTTFNDNEIDVIVGGFPCTDISRAGKMNGGINGEKSGLWFEFRRIINEIKPKYAIIENVNSILGNGLETVLSNLAEIGYDSNWQTLDTKYFGLPQRRSRVYIIGVRDGIPDNAEIFKFREHHTAKCRQKIQSIKKGFKWDFRESENIKSGFAFFTRQRSDEFACTGLSSTLMKRDYKDFTDLVLQNGILRRVTPEERMLLQGFPKDWLIPSTNQNMYSCNGMSVPVIEYIGNLLMDFHMKYENGIYEKDIKLQTTLF